MVRGAAERKGCPVRYGGINRALNRLHAADPSRPHTQGRVGANPAPDDGKTVSVEEKYHCERPVTT
jgi:hypothetical protein